MSRIIHPVGIGDESIKQSAHLKKLVPVSTRSSQPRYLNAEHDSDIVKSDLSHHSLKSKATLDRRTRQSEIVINNDNTLALPPQIHCQISQCILQTRRLLVALELLGRGLA